MLSMASPCPSGFQATDLTLPERQTRFHLPSSIRLLVSPGIRGHTLTFTVVMTFMLATALLASVIGPSSAWQAIFTVGGAAGGTYLILSIFTLSEKTRTLLFARMKRRAVLLCAIFGPMLAGLAYWVNKAGSVEALPIFPAFIAVFYVWVLLQAYFIATPVSHLLARAESGISGEGGAKSAARTLSIAVLFLPAAPLAYGIWTISSWLSLRYQNVQGAASSIIVWTVLVSAILVFTYFISVRWGWRAIRQGRPQVAVFVGGTFLVLWGYLLYRATIAEIGLITQNQATNALMDAALMLVSIIGAMQTFARKLIGRADRRLSQVLPFLVFAFGTVYAVAQFYFILEFAITRTELSVVVNSAVFAVGVLTMMLLLRHHLSRPLATGLPIQAQSQTSVKPSVVQTRHFPIRLPWKKPSHTESPSNDDENAEPTKRSADLSLAESREESAHSEPSETREDTDTAKQEERETASEYAQDPDY